VTTADSRVASKIHDASLNTFNALKQGKFALSNAFFLGYHVFFAFSNGLSGFVNGTEMA
jgi:hypothetical protein